MGKSLRTSLMSYTSLYLRRSRTGRGFEPPDRASPRGLPRRIQSRPTVVPIPARATSESRPVASGILSNTTRHHPTSMPRRTAIVRTITSPPLPERRRAASLTDDLPQNIPSSHTWWPAEVANASWNPPPKAATNTVGPDRSLILPFFMPLCTEVRRRAPRAPVGPQLPYLTVHLV